MTSDQHFYKIDEQAKAEIDLCPTNELAGHPSIHDCRHAVLSLKNGGYVTYDRLLNRIVNGVFYSRESALESAQSYNKDISSPQDMSPNGAALGLVYPTRSKP
jgi:hypothetical protein